MNRIFLSAAAVTGVMLSQGASAQSTETSNMAVSASVSSVCSVSAGALAFGEVATSGATDGTATITVNCTAGGAYTVGLNDGANADAGQRRLLSGSDVLNYDLFKEALHLNRWGNSGAALVSGVGLGIDQSLPVYGQIASGQTLASGNGTPYTDTILVTLTY